MPKQAYDKHIWHGLMSRIGGAAVKGCGSGTKTM